MHTYITRKGKYNHFHLSSRLLYVISQVHQVGQQAQQEVPKAGGGQSRQRGQQGAPRQLQEGSHQQPQEDPHAIGFICVLLCSQKYLYWC